MVANSGWHSVLTSCWYSHNSCGVPAQTLGNSVKVSWTSQKTAPRRCSSRRLLKNHCQSTVASSRDARRRSATAKPGCSVMWRWKIGFQSIIRCGGEEAGGCGLGRDVEGLRWSVVGGGRPSIPPERLLRTLLLQVFCSVRSERLLMEAEPPDSRPRITYRVLGFSPPFAAMEDQLLPSISL